MLINKEIEGNDYKIIEDKGTVCDLLNRILNFCL